MHVPASFPVSEGARGKTSELQPDIEEFDFEEGLEPGADSDGKSSNGEREDNDESDTAVILQEPLENNQLSSSCHPAPAPHTATLEYPSFARSVISAVTPTPTPFLPSWSMEKKLDASVEMNEQLLEENHALAARLDLVEAHCILALEEMGDLKKKLNSNKKKIKECTINVGARGLTSTAGLHAWEAKKAV
ncbi:hypothetical protein BDR04DRAFT_1162755 [Suillus decipiens]|nr:hypothetical protein BDR04DRAFT_1162755 [Suillus decipiens]